MQSFAWIESPLQFLSALEARAEGEFMELQVRGDASGMQSFLKSFETRWLPAEVTLRTAMARPEVPARPPQATVTRARHPVRLLVGDFCSGRFQSALANGSLGRPEHITLIDDGLATEHAVRLLTTTYPTPLRRARQQLSPTRAALAYSTALNLRSALRSGRMSWTTALPLPGYLIAAFTALGGTVARHDFERLRSLDLPAPDLHDEIVLGSSLAVDGLIHDDAYMSWVETATAGRTCAYLPHRREKPEDLARIAALPGVTVLAPGLPVELRLASAPRGARLLSLPTTAASTLRLTMDSPQIEVTPIPPSWWTDAAPDGLRRALNMSFNIRQYDERVDRFTIVAVCDSESYLKWAARTMDALGPDADSHLWLIDTPILPTAEQTRNALLGSSWAGRTIPVVKRGDLADGFLNLTPDVVLAAATGPVVQQIYASAARLPRRPGLVSGLPGVGLPATSKGMRYRRIGDTFITHSSREREEYLRITRELRIPAEVIVSRLPLLASAEPPTPASDLGRPPERIVFATQAKVPHGKEDRVRILLALAEYRRRHPGSEVIVKVRSRPGEQETHREEHTYMSLIDELVADGRMQPGELTVGVGAMSTFLSPGTALVTVSSTAALEAIDHGLPTLVLGDFGVGEEMLNLAFAGSGAIGTLQDLVAGNIGFPNREWLLANYFHPPSTELADSIALLAVRSRERQLPDIRTAARVQDFRRIRAELRTLAPDPVVRGYRAVANRARQIGRRITDS